MPDTTRNHEPDAEHERESEHPENAVPRPNGGGATDGGQQPRPDEAGERGAEHPPAESDVERSVGATSYGDAGYGQSGARTRWDDDASATYGDKFNQGQGRGGYTQGEGDTDRSGTAQTNDERGADFTGIGEARAASFSYGGPGSEQAKNPSIPAKAAVNDAMPDPHGTGAADAESGIDSDAERERPDDAVATPRRDARLR